MFKPFTGQVNYPELELRILDFWKQQRIFEQLQEQLRDAPKWSFLDGPITANNPMGVHHAWGRTYKDLFCRYKAMKGFNQRWQNGFDCQGLWVEVEVEKALGLNSKREIEAFGLERFSQACKQRVETFAERIAQQSIRLGQWMRWYDDAPAGAGGGKPTSYFTFDDNNIEHIWYFLKKCAELDWLYLGHRSMPWCWRCGTSLSQHELVDSYIEKSDPSVYFKCEIVESNGSNVGRPGEHFLVWTTTPWTLTANTALAISPELSYVKVRIGDDTLWLAEARADVLFKGEVEGLATVKGKELLGLTYHGPMEDLPAQANVNRRTIPWDVIAADEGTGIVHIAPGCGAEDFELGKQLKLDVIVPIDENGFFIEGMGFLAGKHVTESAELIREDLTFTQYEIRNTPVLFKWEDYTHRYPVCWRCKTPLVFRLVDEWFIRCDEIRPRMKQALSKVEFTPDYGQALMQNWLDNMGDWCISRKRFFGLPLPFYVCKCGKCNVVGSRMELRERATNPELVDKLPELHRPWIDEIKIRCECGEEVERVTAVGDCWLDAGIVPFSTLDYLPDHVGLESAARSIRNPQSAIRNQQWKDWFPANWISEMREQTRLWFYSMLFMSVTLLEEDRAPYERVLTYEEMRDEKGEPFSKSAGKMIVFDEAAEKMGADPMRWLFAAAPLGQVFRFGYGPANEVKRKLLTLWNCYGFFAMYANLKDSPGVTSVECRVPRNGVGDGDLVTRPSDAPRPPSPATRSELDRWILARLNEVVGECDQALLNFDCAKVVREVEKFIDEYSTWYIRRSRRRVWKSDDLDDKRNCLQTQYEVLVTLSKLIAPIIPFSAEELYQALVPPVDASAPASVHLCEYPRAYYVPPDDPHHFDDVRLIADMNDVLAVVNLAHAFRTNAKIKVRQPLSRAYIGLTRRSMVGVWLDDAEQWLERFEDTIKGEINVKSIELLDPDDPRLDSAVHDNGRSVLLDTTLTDDLRHEGIARDFVRFVQNARKEARLDVSDRIETFYWNDGEVVLVAVEQHRDYIMQETLSVKLERTQTQPDDGYTTKFKIAGETVTLTIVKTKEAR